MFGPWRDTQRSATSRTSGWKVLPVQKQCCSLHPCQSQILHILLLGDPPQFCSFYDSDFKLFPLSSTVLDLHSFYWSIWRADHSLLSCASSGEQPQGQWKHSPRAVSFPRQAAAAAAALFGSEELFYLDLLAGQSSLWSMAQALSVCTAQWSTVKVFDSSGASVEEVMLNQRSALTRKKFFYFFKICFRGLHLI